jgi:hypothetical protein
VLDNAHANDTAITKLGKLYGFGTCHRRIRCGPHTLNLFGQMRLQGWWIYRLYVHFHLTTTKREVYSKLTIIGLITQDLPLVTVGILLIFRHTGFSATQGRTLQIVHIFHLVASASACKLRCRAMSSQLFAAFQLIQIDLS